MKQYTIDYFINYFKEVGEHLSLSTEVNPSDAWEWLDEEEAWALYHMIEDTGMTLIEANDGLGIWAQCVDSTPYTRVMMFLDCVKYTKFQGQEAS